MGNIGILIVEIGPQTDPKQVKNDNSNSNQTFGTSSRRLKSSPDPYLTLCCSLDVQRSS